MNDEPKQALAGGELTQAQVAALLSMNDLGWAALESLIRQNEEAAVAKAMNPSLSKDIHVVGIEQGIGMLATRLSGLRDAAIAAHEAFLAREG